jgi:uncharacterized Fe-S cluster-containing protein
MKLLHNHLSFACGACHQVVEITKLDAEFVRCRCLYTRCDRYGVELVIGRPSIEATPVPVIEREGIETDGGACD